MVKNKIDVIFNEVGQELNNILDLDIEAPVFLDTKLTAQEYIIERIKYTGRNSYGVNPDEDITEEELKDICFLMISSLKAELEELKENKHTFLNSVCECSNNFYMIYIGGCYYILKKEKGLVNLKLYSLLKQPKSKLEERFYELEQTA